MLPPLFQKLAWPNQWSLWHLSALTGAASIVLTLWLFFGGTDSQPKKEMESDLALEEIDDLEEDEALDDEPTEEQPDDINPFDDDEPIRVASTSEKVTGITSKGLSSSFDDEEREDFSPKGTSKSKAKNEIASDQKDEETGFSGDMEETFEEPVKNEDNDLASSSTRTEEEDLEGGNQEVVVGSDKESEESDFLVENRTEEKPAVKPKRERPKYSFDDEEETKPEPSSEKVDSGEVAEEEPSEEIFNPDDKTKPEVPLPMKEEDGPEMDIEEEEQPTLEPMNPMEEEIVPMTSRQNEEEDDNPFKNRQRPNKRTTPKPAPAETESIDDPEESNPVKEPLDQDQVNPPINRPNPDPSTDQGSTTTEDDAEEEEVVVPRTREQEREPAPPMEPIGSDLETPRNPRVRRGGLSMEIRGPKKAVVGAPVVLDFRIENQGNEPISGVIAQDQLPKELKHALSNDLEYKIGVLQPGEVRTTKLLLTAAVTGRTVNRAVVQAEGTERVEAAVELEIVPARVKLARGQPDQWYYGESATCSTAVSNPSNGPLRGLRVVEELPRGARFVRATAGGKYDPRTNSVVWSIRELSPEETKVLMVTLVAEETGQMQSTVHVTDADGECGGASWEQTVHCPVGY